MHDKTNPFLASIKERYLLSKQGSQRRTYHIVLDLKGSGLTYQVGDSLGVFSVNDPDAVQRTLQAMKADGNELVLERNGQTPLRLIDFLTRKANISQFSRKVVGEIAARQPNPEKRALLEKLLGDAHHDALKAYQEQRHLWDLLAEHEEASFTPQEICSMLMPLLPRLYSISSAQPVVGEEVHLTVSHLVYHSNGYKRQGVCTSFLCQRAPLGEPIIPVYVQPHHGFTLPADPSTPLIMVGPGTGVAPFRAFMQQRQHENALGPCWLFFGEWNRQYDFFYEDFWQTVENLRVDTAFSRDQEHKIYVQQRMMENSSELFRWIREGAILYVCGDAHRMAKDVDAVLHKIVEEEGGMDGDAARQFIKRMRSEKRYLRDIY